MSECGPHEMVASDAFRDFDALLAKAHKMGAAKNTETPLTLRYWQEIGGTLCFECLVVPYGPTNERRYLDGLIICDGETRILHRDEIDITGHDVVAIQTKSHRLGMYLMGQTRFSRHVLIDLGARNVRGVVVCSRDDSVMKKLLLRYPETEVGVVDENSVERFASKRSIA